MIANSIGDQARAYATRSSVSRLKNTLHVLTKEAGSGEVDDLGQRVHGDFRIVNDIESDLALAERYKLTAIRAQLHLAEQRRALEPIQTASQKLSTSILALEGVQANGNEELLGDEAVAVFQDAVTALNRRLAGMQLFAGTKIDDAPLLSADEILATLNTEVLGNTSNSDPAQAPLDPASIAEKVDKWFNDTETTTGINLPGDSFVAKSLTANFGAVFTNEAAITKDPDLQRDVPITENKVAKLGITVLEPTIRKVLAGLATSALAGKGYYNGEPDQKVALLKSGARVVFDNDTELIRVIAKIGHHESVAKDAQARHESSLTTLQIARDEIRGVDDFETIAAIRQTETHLDTLYNVTARLSRLSLAEYLR